MSEGFKDQILKLENEKKIIEYGYNKKLYLIDNEMITLVNEYHIKKANINHFYIKKINDLILCDVDPLQSHINQDTRFYCDYNGCNKSYKHKRNLTSHKRIHTNERPFKCSKCDASFKQKSSLHTHLNLHTGLRKYKCNLCGKSFKQNSVLYHHRKYVHESYKNRKYVCSFSDCNKRFVYKCELNRHQKIHENKSE